MRKLRIVGLLVFAFVLSSLAIAADEAKSVPKERSPILTCTESA